MKNRESAKPELAEEFFQATRELHEDGIERPYRAEIRRQILANRAAEAGLVDGLMRRAGSVLHLCRLKESALEAAQESLERQGRIESAMEAQLDHRPPQLLIYLAEDLSATEIAQPAAR